MVAATHGWEGENGEQGVPKVGVKIGVFLYKVIIYQYLIGLKSGEKIATLCSFVLSHFKIPDWDKNPEPVALKAQF